MLRKHLVSPESDPHRTYFKKNFAEKSFKASLHTGLDRSNCRLLFNTDFPIGRAPGYISPNVRISILSQRSHKPEKVGGYDGSV